MDTELHLKQVTLTNNMLARKLHDVMENGSICSPLSITYITALIHLAASGNTEVELTKMMEGKLNPLQLLILSEVFNNDVMKLANAVLINKTIPVRPEYVKLLEQFAMIDDKVDFSNPALVVKATNDFINVNTNGLIKDVLKPDMVDNDTVMVLVNTIYFKALWARAFKLKNTTNAKFNNSINVKMMRQTKMHRYFEDNKVQVVELAYKNPDYCMGFILPKSGTNVADCSTYLNRDSTYSRTSVRVFIPKFTHRRNVDLIPHMQKLGVKDLFECGASNLSGMVTKGGVHVSAMVHEAVVIVDEVATEAAATTVAVCQLECARFKPEPKKFYADHTFIYYIMYVPSRTLLFVGEFNGVEN